MQKVDKKQTLEVVTYNYVVRNQLMSNVGSVAFFFSAFFRLFRIPGHLLRIKKLLFDGIALCRPLTCSALSHFLQGQGP